MILRSPSNKVFEVPGRVAHKSKCIFEYWTVRDVLGAQLCLSMGIHRRPREPQMENGRKKRFEFSCSPRIDWQHIDKCDPPCILNVVLLLDRSNSSS